ncbi:hypothetical protein ACFWNN_37025 [Lentzea sp. NPDC058450]
MFVIATDAGRAALAEARPAHARAVRRALFDRAPEGAFWDVVKELGA